jgi:hypothetical protein
MRPAALILGASVAILALTQCRAATEILLHVTTDAPCAHVEALITKDGSPNGGARTTQCDPTGTGPDHEIGTIVLVPSGANDAPVSATVYASLGPPVDTCATTPVPPNCIVARRKLRFVSHDPLWLEVPMRAVCAGVTCGPDQTCAQGVCVSAVIDPTRCESPGGCDEPPADGGVVLDSGRPPTDASVD